MENSNKIRVTLVSGFSALRVWYAAELDESFEVSEINAGSVFSLSDFKNLITFSVPDVVLLDVSCFREIELYSLSVFLYKEKSIPVVLVCLDSRTLSKAHGFSYREIPLVNIYDTHGRLASEIRRALSRKESAQEKTVLELNEELCAYKMDSALKQVQLVFPAWKGRFLFSPSVKKFLLGLRCAFESELPVLLQGESGSGKGYMAGLIHRNSSRKMYKFRKVCAGERTSETLEAELFGTVRGAFTGAEDTDGFFLETGKGTLFIDEVGEMCLVMQSKVLGVFDTGHFRKIGSIKEHKLEARLIFATDADLKQLSSEGKFKKPLYYRMSVLVITMPPLREHLVDIPRLSEIFSEPFGKHLSKGAIRKLENYSWPGNVRELKNCVERACSECYTLEVPEECIKFD